MNQKFEKSQKLEKWLEWMEEIHNNIQALVEDANMFWEVQDIIRENPRIQKPNAFYSYLARTYFSHAAAGIRRQTELQKVTKGKQLWQLTRHLKQRSINCLQNGTNQIPPVPP